jgi:ssDNA-binding Zn-finger/Zn-ribbon topoisomerase 1
MYGYLKQIFIYSYNKIRGGDNSLKNIKKLPRWLQAILPKLYWQCPECGLKGNGYSVTKKGTVQAHCIGCGFTAFFNDLNVFRTNDPWCKHRLLWESCERRSMWKKDSWTAFCPICRIRFFTYKPRGYHREAPLIEPPTIIDKIEAERKARGEEWWW